MWPNPQFHADLVTFNEFNEEILFCAVNDWKHDQIQLKLKRSGYEIEYFFDFNQKETFLL